MVEVIVIPAVPWLEVCMWYMLVVMVTVNTTQNDTHGILLIVDVSYEFLGRYVDAPWSYLPSSLKDSFFLASSSVNLT
jgi:hypothetical protein